MKALPIKHLSARVPWHDDKWNGNICCNVLDNSFCRILPRVDSEKEPDKEIHNAGKKMSELEHHAVPPCIAEKGTFLSKYEYIREINHAWQKINPLFRDFKPGVYQHKPYSFNAVPFLWMMKDKSTHESEKAKQYDLDYDPEKEANLDLGFTENIGSSIPIIRRNY
ncbi:hypothetical protein [Neobacillus sp. Marseille-QA0830]